MLHVIARMLHAIARVLLFTLLAPSGLRALPSDPIFSVRVTFLSLFLRAARMPNGVLGVGSGFSRKSGGLRPPFRCFPRFLPNPLSARRIVTSKNPLKLHAHAKTKLPTHKLPIEENTK